MSEKEREEERELKIWSLSVKSVQKQKHFQDIIHVIKNVDIKNVDLLSYLLGLLVLSPMQDKTVIVIDRKTGELGWIR